MAYQVAARPMPPEVEANMRALGSHPLAADLRLQYDNTTIFVVGDTVRFNHAKHGYDGLEGKVVAHVDMHGGPQDGIMFRPHNERKQEDLLFAFMWQLKLLEDAPDPREHWTAVTPETEVPDGWYKFFDPQFVIEFVRYVESNVVYANQPSEGWAPKEQEPYKYGDLSNYDGHRMITLVPEPRKS